MADPTTGRVGEVQASEGTITQTRMGRFAETIMQQLSGWYYESSRLGRIFGAVGTAGVAPPATISTTAILSLYNPAGSGVRLWVVRSTLAYVSGTLGTGNVFHCIANSTTQTAPSAGTLLSAVNLDAGNANAAKGVARMGSTVVAPTAFGNMAYLAPELATSVTAPQITEEEFAGAVCLEPGTSYQLQSIAAAGTSPLVAPGVIWAEVPTT